MKTSLITVLVFSCIATAANAELKDTANLKGLPFGDLWYVRATVDDNSSTVTDAKKQLPAAKAELDAEIEARRKAAQNPFNRPGYYLAQSVGETMILATRVGCEAPNSDRAPVSLAKLNSQNVAILGGCGYVSNADPDHILVKWVGSEGFESLDAALFSKVDIDQLEKLEDTRSQQLLSSFQLLRPTPSRLP